MDAVTTSGALVPITHEIYSRKHSNCHCGHHTGIKKEVQPNAKEYKLWS